MSERLETKYCTSGINWSDVKVHELPGIIRDGEEAPALLDGSPKVAKLLQAELSGPALTQNHEPFPFGPDRKKPGAVCVRPAQSQAAAAEFFRISGGYSDWSM